MNKSIITNTLSILLIAIGYQTNQNVILSAGLFAFSGAITNWLAIHMLFERVPGLYGSGVIPNRFEEFKAAIKSLMMKEFFTEGNIQKFMNQELGNTKSLDLAPIVARVDFNPTFDSLVDVISASSFGGMLAMFGGAEALQPLKEPFVKKMEESIVEMSQSEEIKNAIKEQFSSDSVIDEAQQNIEAIIDQRLNELTPKLVKEIVASMIKQHLGWLVVWGGVFGGIIGIIASYL
ncbi:DUF445 domain-containing protein [Vibrio viridaestus]|uniref:DUF445 domain-containing protein n=1 Tax=Vibrio viridaestus TaxID=2487322 RepID=A0A3N9TKQ4_9VIBR|nr:DUF445 domain-containing protein [Vibrio viridaestus]RQW64929.1 DUF445 domain-containing protein [Vibrio viridaestus]